MRLKEWEFTSTKKITKNIVIHSKLHGDNLASSCDSSYLETKPSQSLPQSLWGDFVHKSPNLDSFLHQIATLPMMTQNQLLTEKLILFNNKTATSLDLLQ